MTLTKTALFSLLFSLSITAAHAEQPPLQEMVLATDVRVDSTQDQTVTLDRARYIKNLTIHAHAGYCDSMIDVLVNGEVKGTIYAPGSDPTYIVTVAETTESIQFHYKRGCAMEISEVVGLVSTWGGSPGFPWPPGVDGDAITALSSEAVSDVVTLAPYSDLNDEATYLMPIKKSAGQLYVMVIAHADYSEDTYRAMRALYDQIDFASNYIDDLMEKDSLFGTAVELLSVKEKLAEYLCMKTKTQNN